MTFCTCWLEKLASKQHQIIGFILIEIPALKYKSAIISVKNDLEMNIVTSRRR